MIKKAYTALAIVYLFLSACQADKQVSIREKNQRVTIQNQYLAFTFDLATGSYSISSPKQKISVVSEAVFQLNGWRSDQPGQQRSWETTLADNEFGQGKSLHLRISGSDQPEMVLSATLYENQSFIDLGSAVTNTLEDPIQVREIYTFSQGQLYDQQNLSANFAMIDGFSGGEPLEYGERLYSPLTRRNALKSRNNLLLTFTAKEKRNTLVMGGLNYEDFEKFAFVEQKRRVELLYGSDKEKSLLAYLDLPADTTDQAATGEIITLIHGKQAKKWQYHEFHCSESATTAVDPDHITIEIKDLLPGTPYYAGFSWWRSLWHGDRQDHYQSVWLEYEKDQQLIRVPWFENELLPRFDGRKKEQIEQIEVVLPQEAVDAGTLRFIVEHGTMESKPDPNVYLSEFWIRDGSKQSLYPASFTSVDSVSLPRISYQASLFASDPVGKLVRPGETYDCPDRFYLSVNEQDPFAALENYAQAVVKAQHIELPMYDFPTVCLWYAEVDFYGGGLAENTTVGAVEEMKKIRDAGFLHYSRAAVRLVPDSYMPVNQQGWWDDEHWAKPVEKHNGSKNGRYLEPYETSEKWGKAVTDLGGIPLTYFQTGFRSEDYAKSFPEHMLFNQTYAWKGEVQDTGSSLFTDWHQTWARNGRVWGYDYSDPGFISHMETVYANLKKGGIQGLMFDYPASGWARMGGLENKDWTTARAYRNIFALASEGLGPGAYVHERNMERGTDVSVGTVASMRTENDTDLMDGTTVTRCGLRWYKNRVLYNQDTDSKNLVRLEGNPDAVRAVITMAYVTTGRLLLANSFAQMSPQTIHDLSRSFPYHTQHQSARPVDAFVNEIPQVYDFAVAEDWHQVTFYNPDFDQPSEVSINLSGPQVDGSLGLDPKAEYYVYDFWNDRLAGIFTGEEQLKETLRPGEARMFSFRKKTQAPQVISTNRHLMQGYLDLHQVSWNPETKTLSGSCEVIAGDPFIVTIALNGFTPEEAPNLESTQDLVKLTLDYDQSKSSSWAVKFR